MNPNVQISSTSNIIAFPRITRTAPNFIFQDRDVLLNVEAKLLDGLSLGLCLHDEDEFGEFATFTVVGEWCSSWAVARQGGSLLLWNTKSSADLGIFSSMVDVIQALEALTNPTNGPRAQLIEVSDIKPTSNVVFLTAEQLGRRARHYQNAA